MGSSKILLHACCAVCAAYPLELLKEDGFEPVVYFFNPNIYPYDEYQRRLNELIRYSDKKQFELIIDKSGFEAWHEAVKGLENEPERGLRCLKCFEYRLNAAAKKACSLGIDKITSTLTVSPYKNSKNVIETGKNAAEAVKIEYLEYDFKKKNGFLKTMDIARQENFYRQTYCGCKYSIRT